MQTDRQTDKATWWSLTAFDEGEQQYIADGKYPGFIQAIHGGLEKCPKSGRVHYQGAIQCKNQQRFSAIKKVFPKSHLEPAISKEALRKYCMKADTAVGEKVVVANKQPYYTLEMIMRLLAITHPSVDCPGDAKSQFWSRVNIILLGKPYLVGLLAKPDVWRMYEHTRQTWTELMTDAESGELMGEEAIVLQPPTGSGDNLISHVPVYNGSTEEGFQEASCEEIPGEEVSSQEARSASRPSGRPWPWPQ